MKITIIHGGTSTESKYSTENAKAVYDALQQAGHDASLLFYDQKIFKILQEERPDLVFLCVQGTGHGDGTLQGILDFMQIPYTGAGMQQAAVINDKVICQALFEEEGIPVAKHFSISLEEYESGQGPCIFEKRMKAKDIHYPVVAKAISQGACLGISYIGGKDAYGKIKDSFLASNKNRGQRILIEEFLEGKSLTVPLLSMPDGWEAFPFIGGELLKEPDKAGNTIFDHSNDEQVLSFSQEIDEKIINIAIKAAELTGARDYCRVDFIYNEKEQRISLLEINAVPGLRANSYYSLSAKAKQIPFEDLICRIVESAGKRIVER